MKKTFSLLLLAVVLLFFSCGGGQSADSDSSNASSADSVEVSEDSALLELTPMQVDSLMFRLSHHYGPNFNFCVKADSLLLVPGESELAMDTNVVYEGDLLVVASVKEVVGDTANTVWVRVARDQRTMGWIAEDELLRGAVPDDMISQMLDFLTGSRSLWMSAILAVGAVAFLVRRGKRRTLQIVRFDEMDSFYPTLLIILVALVASLYASIQNFVPEFWQEFYFHPTLNPLRLPMPMSLLVLLVWLVIIVFVAVIEEVYHNFYILPGMAYLLEMTGLSMLVYLVISWSTLYYVGYLILPILIVSLVRIYFRYIRCPYVCGNCGGKMHTMGVCPHCGTENQN